MAKIDTLTGDLSAAGPWATVTGYTLSGANNEIATFASGVTTALLNTDALTWDIADSTFSWKMPTIPTGTSAPSVELRNSGGLQWRFVRNNTGNTWQCRQVSTAVGTNVPDATVTANPFWRFRHVSTPTATFFWEYSPDGTNWTTWTSTTTITSATTALAPRFQVSAAITGPWVVSNVNGINVLSAAPAQVNISNYHQRARVRASSY